MKWQVFLMRWAFKILEKFSNFRWKNNVTKKLKFSTIFCNQISEVLEDILQRIIHKLILYPTIRNVCSASLVHHWANACSSVNWLREGGVSVASVAKWRLNYTQMQMPFTILVFMNGRSKQCLIDSNRC